MYVMVSITDVVLCLITTICIWVNVSLVSNENISNMCGGGVLSPTNDLKKPQWTTEYTPVVKL